MRKRRQENLETLLLGRLGSEASSKLAIGAKVKIKIQEQCYLYERTKLGAKLHLVESEAVDFSVLCSDAALEFYSAKAAHEESNLADFGIELLKGLLSKNTDRKLELKLHSGPFELWRKGYVSLVLAAGRPMVSFLAEHGLANVKQILDALGKMRSS